jgi:hypothetical protein
MYTFALAFSTVRVLVLIRSLPTLSLFLMDDGKGFQLGCWYYRWY